MIITCERVFDFGTSIKSMLLRALDIELKGTAEVQWALHSKHIRKGGNTNLYQCQGHEIVYTFNEVLIEDKDGDFIEVNQGLHSFKFSTVLPNDLPSSFEGKYGSIRYVATATLQRPWRFVQQTKLLFTIISPVNLNTIDRAKQRIFGRAEKSYGCCCYSWGPLQVFVDLPYSGFVSGQSIPLNIFIDNTTKFRIHKVVTGIYRVMEWRCQYPAVYKKEDIYEILKVNLGGVRPHEKMTSRNQIQLPIMQVYNFKKCSLINCQYHLTVRIVMSKFHKDILIHLPIYLGTDPLSYELTQTSDSDSSDNESKHNIISLGIPKRLNKTSEEVEKFELKAMLAHAEHKDDAFQRTSVSFSESFINLKPQDELNRQRRTTKESIPESILVVKVIIENMLEEVNDILKSEIESVDTN